MEQIVRVQETYDDGTALVAHLRQSACSGDCHKCAGCGAVSQEMLLKVENTIGAKTGDMVRIESESAPVLRAAAILYLIPVLLFFVGYLIGAMLWERGALLGGLFFVIGISFAIGYDRKVVSRKESGYTITGFAEC